MWHGSSCVLANGSELMSYWFGMIWVFPKIGVSQNGWFIMENPIKMGWFGGPTPIFGNTHFLEFCMSRPVLNSVVSSTMFHTQSYSVYLNLVIGTRSRFSQASSHTWWFSRLTVFPMQPHLGVGPQKHQLLYQSLAERQLDGNFAWWRWRSFLARDMVKAH